MIERVSVIELEECKNLRLFMQKYIYSEIPYGIIPIMMESLNSFFNLFSINYDTECNCIVMKIKKTEMKKNQDFIHDVMYYYNDINEIISNTFIKYNKGIESIKREKDNSINTDYLYNKNKVCYIYNITTLSDNIIVIYL